MKIAVSIPDPIFTASDRMARRLGVSRSELYARALRRFVSDESDDAVTARLDALYDHEHFALDPELARAQRRAVAEHW